MQSDSVHSPPHYTAGRRVEVIDTIEDAIRRAPDPVVGNCQGQVLRYLLRMWDKDDPVLNASKAKWYLNRLLEHLSGKSPPDNTCRSKSVNLKEQALTALHAIATGANDAREQLQDLTTIREALEQLP